MALASGSAFSAPTPFVASALSPWSSQSWAESGSDMMSRPYRTVLTGASRRRSTIHNCMEVSMRDVLLQFSGALAILVALIHGVLTETKIFPRVTIEPERLRTLFRLVWQIPTVAWIACGVLLIAAPSWAWERGGTGRVGGSG